MIEMKSIQRPYVFTVPCFGRPLVPPQAWESTRPASAMLSRKAITKTLKTRLLPSLTPHLCFDRPCHAVEAGRLAARLAREDGETEILQKHFAEACDVIKKRIDTVREKQSVRYNSIKGGVCI